MIIEEKLILSLSDNDQLFIVEKQKIQGNLCECCGALSSLVDWTVDCVTL